LEPWLIPLCCLYLGYTRDAHLCHTHTHTHTPCTFVHIVPRITPYHTAHFPLALPTFTFTQFQVTTHPTPTPATYHNPSHLPYTHFPTTYHRSARCPPYTPAAALHTLRIPYRVDHSHTHYRRTALTARSTFAARHTTRVYAGCTFVLDTAAPFGYHLTTLHTWTLRALRFVASRTHCTLLTTAFCTLRTHINTTFAFVAAVYTCLRTPGSHSCYAVRPSYSPNDFTTPPRCSNRFKPRATCRFHQPVVLVLPAYLGWTGTRLCGFASTYRLHNTLAGRFAFHTIFIRGCLYLACHRLAVRLYTRCLTLPTTHAHLHTATAR